MASNEGIIHILTYPKTTTDREKQQLGKLDKYQKKYLSRRCCGCCEWPLDRMGCGSHYEACSESDRIKRRKACLKEYKPRFNRRKKE